MRSKIKPMEISEIDIKTLLPQQVPFVMVDRLLQCDKIITRTEFTIRQENLFVQNERFIESGLVENIAQTCAARMGYINSVVHDGNVKIGFIGSVKNMNIYSLPKINDTISTRVEVLNEVFNITLVNAEIRCGEILIADCEMKISEQ